MKTQFRIALIHLFVKAILKPHTFFHEYLPRITHYQRKLKGTRLNLKTPTIL